MTVQHIYTNHILKKEASNKIINKHFKVCMIKFTCGDNAFCKLFSERNIHVYILYPTHLSTRRLIFN